MPHPNSILVLTLVLLAAGCTPFWAGAKMRDDIDRLEASQQELNESLREKEMELTEMISSARADVDELNVVIGEATDLLQRNSADFGAEMEQLRQEMQRMRGATEQLAFKFQKLEQELKLFKEDVDLRFADGGGADLSDDPDELYKAASEKFKAGEHRLARKGFEKFLRVAPKDRRAPDATFNLGETFFKEGQFVSAIYEYQKILKQHSSSGRADDATFRIGESFARLGKCAEAKVFFETVVEDFKNSSYRDRAQKQLRALEAKCG